MVREADNGHSQILFVQAVDLLTISWRIYSKRNTLV